MILDALSVKPLRQGAVAQVIDTVFRIAIHMSDRNPDRIGLLAASHQAAGPEDEGLAGASGDDQAVLRAKVRHDSLLTQSLPNCQTSSVPREGDVDVTQASLASQLASAWALP
jgi:hypothetical protein